MNRPRQNAPFDLANAVQNLEPEGAYRVLARAQALQRDGHDVIHLEIGEPDFPTAPAICDAGVEAIRAGHTRYSPTSGIARLREAIAEDAGRRRGIVIDPDQVVVGPGAKPHLFFPTLALVDAGDEVIYPDPGFPTYEAMIKVAGGKPVPITLNESNGFSFDLCALHQLVNPRTKMIILNSPSNPTGGVMAVADLQRVANIAQEYDCWVLSDEIYSRMCYDQVGAPSIAALNGMMDRTVIVDGFSKTFAMTGWRLGYGVMPKRLAEKVSLLLVHAVGCTADFTQHAGWQAIVGDQTHTEFMLAEYQQRRDKLVAGLNEITGVRCQIPAGAFYAFPNVQSICRSSGQSSAQLADLLLEQFGVALLPGTSFGTQGEGYLRICYANSVANIEAAVARISDAFASL